MLVLVIDRYLPVFCPYFYPKAQAENNYKPLSCSVASWCISLLVCLVMVHGLLDCYEFSQVTWLCTHTSLQLQLLDLYSLLHLYYYIFPLAILSVIL